MSHAFRNSAYTQPTTVYVALYTAAPTDAGGGTEVTGGSYARVAVTFGAPSGSPSSMSNSGEVDFGTTSAAWGTVTHFGIFDAATVGNLMGWDTLTAQKVIGSGDPVSFPIASLTVEQD